MCDQLARQGSADTGRRRFITSVILAVHGAIAATLSAVLGRTVLSPGLARLEPAWRAAGALSDLTEEEPTAVIVRIARRNGYAQSIERRLVYLMKTDEGHVTALSSVCPHLGCRVSWHADEKAFMCPCHGGAFDIKGAVKAGPPPGPLTAFRTRTMGDRVLVQL
jgi:Rieske Fe-S protein